MVCSFWWTNPHPRAHWESPLLEHKTLPSPRTNSKGFRSSCQHKGQILELKILLVLLSLRNFRGSRALCQELGAEAIYKFSIISDTLFYCKIVELMKMHGTVSLASLYAKIKTLIGKRVLRHWMEKYDMTLLRIRVPIPLNPWTTSIVYFVFLKNSSFSSLPEDHTKTSTGIYALRITVVLFQDLTSFPPLVFWAL